MKKITSKQRVFVKEYLKSLDIEKAAIIAGYERKKAKLLGEKLLENQQIIEYIEIQLKQKTKSLQIEKGYVVKKLITVIEDSLLENDKKPKDISNGLKALDILCKQIEPQLTTENNPENAVQLSIIENLDKNKI